MRGIEVVFQLEEGEVLGEPLPARADRRAVLVYEAAEGGAGVLNRLVEDPLAIGKVTREALMLMHFDKVDEAIAAGDAKLLVDRQGQACVRGCYRCLLSYYNQPDHEVIDRTSDEAKQFLVDLARGQVVLFSATATTAGESGWLNAFDDAGIPAPNPTGVTFGEQQVRFVWRDHYVGACPGPLASAAREAAEAKGWTLFELPQDPVQGLPAGMTSILKR
jgi:hypothetical protein